MVAAVHHQLALRHQARVLARGGGRHQGILYAVEDQHRPRIAGQDLPQRPLVGLVEIPGVLDTQHPVIPETEMGDQLAKSPKPGQLQAVDRVVQVILAGQLVFLGTDRGKQGERADPVGRQLGDVECNPAAEAESDDVGLLDVEAVEQLEDVVRVCDDRIVGNLPGGAAETRQVWRNDPEAIGQSRSQRPERAVVSRTAVQEDYRWPITRAVGVLIPKRDMHFVAGLPPMIHDVKVDRSLVTVGPAVPRI
jgi:hypothetical protein